jgi:hypothetical protein
MVWTAFSVFALFVIAGATWIAAIYVGLEDQPFNALMYGFWTSIAIIGLVVLFQDLVEGNGAVALTGAVVGVGLTVLMYEPEKDSQQTA